MSKKRFSSGLDSLFDNQPDEQGFDGTIAAKAPPPSVSEIEAEVKAIVMKRTTAKNFTSDLDSLFQDAFTEALEEKAEKLRRRTLGVDDPFESKQSTYKKPLSGLDALIRETVDASLMNLEHAPIKRFTILFENKKIEKLKNIAKQERAFVKDLIGDVLTEFIENYERQHKL